MCWKCRSTCWCCQPLTMEILYILGFFCCCYSDYSNDDPKNVLSSLVNIYLVCLEKLPTKLSWINVKGQGLWPNTNTHHKKNIILSFKIVKTKLISWIWMILWSKKENACKFPYFRKLQCIVDNWWHVAAELQALIYNCQGQTCAYIYIGLFNFATACDIKSRDSNKNCTKQW